MGDFSDDDLDGLVEDDFLALEEASAPPTQLLSHPLHTYAARSRLQEDANGQHGAKTIHVSAVGHRDFQQQNTTLLPISQPSPTLTSQHHEEQLSQINTRQAPGPSTQRERWRQQRYTATTPGLQRAATTGVTTLAHHPSSPARAVPFQTEVHAQYVDANQGSSLELSRLRAELEEMRREQERLRQAAKIANDQMLVKAGEVSILRSKQTKEAQEYERRLQDERNKQRLDAERHQAELEQSRKEKERLASHNQFLNHERNDQITQLRQGQKSAARVKEIDKTNGIKRKTQKPSHFGDGFDDDELMVISPSKAASRSRNTTPKGGLKRKRDALSDSPLKPLELSESMGFLPEADIDLQPIVAPVPAAAFDKQDQSFQFLQLLLNRQLSRDERKTHEVLSGYSFPSDTRKTLSTILTDRLATFSINQESEDFSSSIGNAILSLWSRCLEEKYHKPIRYLLDLIQFTLSEGSPQVVANLVDAVVDLAQRTADVNVIPRYKRFKRKMVTDESDNRLLDPDISTKDCLELLDLTIVLCIRDQDLVIRFWKSVRFDFISMLLRNSQDVQDVTLMAKILSRSVRADTFAMIVAPPASQSVSEQHVIDRLSAMLIEVPRTIEGEQQPDVIETSNMRLEILNLIDTMLSKQYCGEAFAKHPAALGRLVRVMHDELNALYAYRYGHEKQAELVNQATRLLYQTTKQFDEAVGHLQEKLRAPPTSVYKHLIVLSRLAFSEGAVLEENIDEDVVEMAHEMLELMVSPEEGEAIQKAFIKEGNRTITALQYS